MENNTLTLQIEPLDTLFFRDGKPFSMGDDSWADGIFPPAPSVIYGAVRTWILANNEIVNIDNIIDETSDLEIIDLYYSVNGKTVLSLPFDFGTKKEKDEQIRYEEKENNIIEVERFTLKNNNFISSINTKKLICSTENYILETAKNAFISTENFISYLKNEKNVKKIKVDTLNSKTESKIGIARSNTTLSSEDGKLYRVGLNRFENLKFIVKIKSKHLSENYSKILKLGGEGKIVSVDKFLKGKKGAKSLRIKTGIKTRKLLIYLATPAIFHNENPDITKYLNIKAELLASSVGKAINIGGFDMKVKRPKTMFKAVPSGSIYFYELEEEIEIDSLQGNKISDELKEQGFGIAYFGTF